MQSSEIISYDPLAAVAIFAPHLMQYADGVVEIELNSDLLAGMTIWDPKAEARPNALPLVLIQMDSLKRIFA
jgi:inosine-uridine nucleoside N-ribohydrolase